MPISPGLTQFQYLYELSPITLLGGVAGQLPGGTMSIFSLTQSSGFASLLSPFGGVDQSFFAKFVPIPGATAIDNDVGHYPFANQATAANAIITKPLSISYRMIAPAQTEGSYFTRQAQFSALQQTLQQHILLGGMFACATPALFWDTCLLLTMRDVTGGEGTQRQVVWQLDFEQPLVTQQQAQQQYNTLLSKINSGTQLTPGGDGAVDTSGPQAAVGNAGSGQGPAVSPPVQGQGQGYSAGGALTGNGGNYLLVPGVASSS